MPCLSMIALLIFSPSIAFASDGTGGVNFGFLLILIAIGVAFYGIYKHVKGEITIYSDYTDASITVACVIIPGIVHILAKFVFGESSVLPFMIALMVFLGGLYIVIKHTRYFNPSLVDFFLALFTKYLVTFLFVFAIAALIFGSGSTRRKGEGSYAFELRRQRESRNNTLLIIALTAILTYLSHLMTRDKIFVPLDDYFANKQIQYDREYEEEEGEYEETMDRGQISTVSLGLNPEPVLIPVLPEIVEFACPNCDLPGRVPTAKLPLSGAYATCPKCKDRFLVSYPAS